MRLSLLVFACLVVTIGATSQARDLSRIGETGYIWIVFPEERPQYNPEFELLCRIDYCHQQDEKSQCGRKCTQRAPKIDFGLMRDRIYGVNNTEPVPNKDVCKKECSRASSIILATTK
ncbi:hypothetical protein PRIPAC_87606 [Pristionchus pacificus]|uniref:Uncharacterized protein n=1 Tax=Pristionchus pacificus TaxID=54126 RepID=A0A454Y6R4_PRIPA|nr:hypothetical protein PRIPAC_87606 [Pristionchus pacificus]|eukprot:PDM61465.1 hypothetical protein PRIPAC_50907 [Pristionchus pacificus]